MNTSAKLSASQKGFAPVIILIAVVGVILLGGVYYLGTKHASTPTIPIVAPTTSPAPIASQTTDWKTYTSKTYGYSLNYPSNWETYAYGKTPADEPIDGTERFFRPVGDKSAEISFEIGSEDSANLDVRAQTIEGYSWDNKVTLNITVDGIQAVKVSGKWNGKENTAIIFIKDGRSFALQTLGDYGPILDQMIPTFKFTTQTQTTDPATADWKTYTSADLSFKYPASWVATDSTISSSSPKVIVIVDSKESSLMNECMQLKTTETKNDLIIKKFEADTTGAMCSGGDSSARDIWVVPSEDAYSPGISYRYSNTDSNQAEAIFDQILATFKFN